MPKAMLLSTAEVVGPWMPVAYAVDYLKEKYGIVLSDQGIRLNAREGHIKFSSGPRGEFVVERESLDQFARERLAKKRGKGKR